MKTIFNIYIIITLLFMCGCRPTPKKQAHKNDETEIRTSYRELKQAISDGNYNDIIKHVSPNTIKLFKTAQKFGLSPNSIDTDDISQFEVILGLQARWLLTPDELKDKSINQFIEWSVHNNCIQIDGFATINLGDIESDGYAAIAQVKTRGVISTNTVLTFGKYKRKWKMELDKVFLASELLLTSVREEQNMGKTEFAVRVIENIARQQIPAIHELLYTPEVQQKITELKKKTPTEVYDAVIAELSVGRQGDAEDLLEIFTAIHTNSQSLAFAQATCSRSRWSKNRADWQFNRVLELDPTTPKGNCAKYMLDLDARRQVETNMMALKLLTKKYPDNPFILWNMALACRDHFKLSHKTTYSKDAEQCYRQMLKIFDMGPVLLHQTFANVLSEELHQDEEALKHRYIAVELEPKPWTYQGLANTLTRLKKYKEANETFEKLLNLAPDDAIYWRSWAISLANQHKYEECIEKCKKILKYDPSDYDAYNRWGDCLRYQDKWEEALEKYRQSILLNPASTLAYNAAIQILDRLNRYEEAIELTAKKNNIISEQNN